jgi:hypothetical protein
LGVDPLADAPLNIGTSPYAYVWNNPLKFIDPDGRHGQSHHIDADGNYLGEVQDGDESVYMHENGTQLSEISNRIYQSPAPQGEWGDTSGGGVQVGGVGVQINAPRDIDHVVEIGIRLTAIVGAGVTGGFGVNFDDHGDFGIYGDLGIGWGFDLSAGGEITSHTSTASDGSLRLSETGGQGVSRNFGLGVFDLGFGGNDDSNMDFMKTRGSKYRSNTFGISASPSPFSFTETLSGTGIIKLSNSKKTIYP